MLKAKILVVDDNDGIRAALKILLMRYFAEVELIASPKELRSVVLRFKPDVVLLDIFNSLGMPTSTAVSMVFELLGASFCIPQAFPFI